MFALITGASSGIGLELAKIFAANGYNLVLIARNVNNLEKAEKIISKINGKIRILSISIDLSKQGASNEIVSLLNREKIAIDVLVNNAGFGNYGKFEEINWESENDQLQLNIVALTHLTKLILPGMIKRGSGKILNVASTAAFQPGPFMAVYYASKAYVLSFSQALSEELKGTGVTVSALCPGPTKTNFQKRAGLNKGHSLISMGMMDADVVAKAGFEGMMEGKRIVIPGWKNKLGAFLAKVLPRKTVVKFVRRMQEGRK